ncbi:MAG: hypothetical protein GF418_17140 [Chitinivibrionales bacterium]|nr:hypothetical protein [Chitinivibrionales bacterium]MBD3397345.1 hypothetical protein [Chitinivibrionales bacterium]
MTTHTRRLCWWISLLLLQTMAARAADTSSVDTAAQEPGVAAPAAMPYDTLAGDLPNVVVASDQPYLVAGDIYVPTGKSVTIEPGAVLLFVNFTGLQIQGRLVAKGTGDNPVVFTSENDTEYNRHESPDPAPYDWNGVYIHKDAIGTEMEHCIVQYSVDGLVSETRFVRLAPCVFRHNGRANLTIEGVEHDVGEGPYEYSLSVKDAKLDGVPLSVLSDPLAPRRNILRYSGLALAVGGAALGVVFASNFNAASDKLDRLSSTEPSNLAANTSDDWEDARDERRRQALSMVAGWSVMAVGGIGLSISFTF